VRLKIGLSACFSHADSERPLFKGKTLQYVEQSIAHWAMSTGALVVMIPCPTGATRKGDVEVRHFAEWLDGLILHGGADLWPGSYGETPLQEQWRGDRVRDEYEIALTKAFESAGKPVFGVCRGLQLLNVAYGGSLYQDIATQIPGALTHRDGAVYDQNFHAVDIVPGSRLAQVLGGSTTLRVNSIHHQGIKTLASEFAAEAVSCEDGIIEAIRRRDPTRSYMAAVQWHPEFHEAENNSAETALLEDFLAAARERRSGP
jgi:putative glutamine amidotransferase